MRKVRFTDHISPASIEQMLTCFTPTFKSFSQGETMLSYSDCHEQVGMVLEGHAKLYFSDIDGDYGLLETYQAGDLFGDVFSLPLEGYAYTVTAVTDCRVVFISYQQILHPCCKVCEHHSQLINNLFLMTTQKSQELSLHVNILGQSTTRKKLLAYLQFIQAGSDVQAGEPFDIPLSLGALSEYLCVERTAMMREIRKMNEDGLIDSNRRTFSILT